MKKDIKEEMIEEPEENKVKKLIKELIPYVIILIVVVLIRTFIVTFVLVSGPSMQPTLDGGELMLLNKYDDNYERFDVIVIKMVNQNNKKEEIIKRIIALPGETIVCENGIIFVNGIRQDEEYSTGATNDFELVKLGKDEYFVMGDNRLVSADSRTYGAFKKDQIKGKAMYTVFPFNEIGKVK